MFTLVDTCDSKLPRLQLGHRRKCMIAPWIYDRAVRIAPVSKACAAALSRVSETVGSIAS
jgi:hypothetical protein